MIFLEELNLTTPNKTAFKGLREGHEAKGQKERLLGQTVCLLIVFPEDMPKLQGEESGL